MKIQIQSLDFNANSALLKLIEDKIEKISHFTDRILESKVILKLDKSDTRENKICEIILVIPGNDLFAKKSGNTFEEALEHVVSALEKQIITWKTKSHDRQVRATKA